jgi:hypothetical protein
VYFSRRIDHLLSERKEAVCPKLSIRRPRQSSSFVILLPRQVKSPAHAENQHAVLINSDGHEAHIAALPEDHWKLDREETWFL